MSPPGMTDCSGSHWRMEPLTATVLTLAKVLSPPRAWTALLTRPSLRGEAVAPDATINEARSRTAIRLMVPLLGTGNAGKGTWRPRRCQLAAARDSLSSLGWAGHGAVPSRARPERNRAGVPRRDREPRVDDAGRRERSATGTVARRDRRRRAPPSPHPPAEPSALRIPSAPGRPYRVHLLAGRQHLEIAVDPSTLRIIGGRAAERSLLVAVRSLHASFHGGRLGSLVVGLLGLWLLVESLT